MIDFFTQRELLREGFWNAFVKGTAQVLNSALPELTAPINQLDTGLKNVGSEIARGWRGEKTPKGATAKAGNTYSPGASKYAVYEYKGKYYKQDLTSPAVKEPGGMKIKVWEVDKNTGKKQSNTPHTMGINTRGTIYKVI